MPQTECRKTTITHTLQFIVYINLIQFTETCEWGLQSSNLTRFYITDSPKAAITICCSLPACYNTSRVCQLY